MSTPFDYTQYLLTSELAVGEDTDVVVVNLSGTYQTAIQTLFNPGFVGDIVFFDMASSFGLASGESISSFDYRWQIRPYNLGQDWEDLLEVTGHVPSGATVEVIQTDTILEMTSGESYSPTLVRLQVKSTPDTGEDLNLKFYAGASASWGTKLRGVGNF